MATNVTLGGLADFFASIETSLKNSIGGFQGFGSNISADVRSVVVDGETVLNGVMTALGAAGNGEVAVVSPLVSVIEGVVNVAVQAIFGATAATAPATLTAATQAVAGTSPTPSAPVVAPLIPVPDLTDPDAGAIGG